MSDLDPLPWRVTDRWGATSRYPREIVTVHSAVIFDPRPEYEQNEAAYVPEPIHSHPETEPDHA